MFPSKDFNGSCSEEECYERSDNGKDSCKNMLRRMDMKSGDERSLLACDIARNAKCDEDYFEDFLDFLDRSFKRRSIIILILKMNKDGLLYSSGHVG